MTIRARAVLGADPGAERMPSLSPSRAADFMTCPLLYRFRTIDRLPEEPAPDAVRGTVVHKVLEDLFDLPAVDRTPERAADMLVPAWEHLLEIEPALAGMFGPETLVEQGVIALEVVAQLDRGGHGRPARSRGPRGRRQSVYLQLHQQPGRLLQPLQDMASFADTAAVLSCTVSCSREPAGRPASVDTSSVMPSDMLPMFLLFRGNR
jgi:hypothetical protein